MNFDSHICSEVLKNIEFEKPIQENFSLAYTQSIFTFHQLFKRTLGNKINNFLISGFPTNGVNIFDELLALRSLINREDFMEVKIKLEYLLTLINNSTGFFPLNENSTKTSLSGLFLLVKRIEDLIFALDEKNKLYEFFTYKELEIIYLKLVKSFNLITQNNWSEDFSLLFSQMEDLSIEVEEGGFYLETQVGYLNFISVLTTFSTILHKKEAKSYLELEQDLKSKIRKDFFTNNILIHKNLQAIKTDINNHPVPHSILQIPTTKLKQQNRSQQQVHQNIYRSKFTIQDKFKCNIKKTRSQNINN